MQTSCEITYLVFRLMVHVKNVTSQGRVALCDVAPTSTRREIEASMQQASRNPEPDVNKGLQSLDHDQFEEIAIQILDSYSMLRDWGKAVSRPNEYGQTLAHLTVSLGYTRLLEQLISWKIDLSVRDATGVTALHFARLFDRPDCVSLLTRNGADQQIRCEPDQSGVSFNGTLNQSSDLASERAGCIIDREETLGAERGLVPKWPREENRFNPRRTNLLEFGAGSIGLANLDLNSGSPTTDPPETGAIGVLLPGATSRQSVGMAASEINGVSDAWSNAEPPNRKHSILLGNGAHPEMSYSHINTTKGTLWPSSHLDTLSAGVSGTSIPSGALRSKHETPANAQIEGSYRTADEAFRKEVVLTKGGDIRHQTATLPVADMSSPWTEWNTFRELENLEAGASSEFTPQGSSPQILPLETPSTGTPILASPSSTPTPITSPALPAAASTKKLLSDSLQSLLGTTQSNPPDARDPHPIDLADGGLVLPTLPPPQPYEFREMTLGCRFGTPFKIYISIPIVLTNLSPPASSRDRPVAHHPRRYNMDHLSSKASYAHEASRCT
jgi:hypothetical protein